MNQLRKLREDAGLSVRKGAAHLGIALTTIQRWEAPDYNLKKLPLESLLNISERYGITLHQLIDLPCKAKSN